MKLFKSTEVSLHPVEKILIIVNAALVGLILVVMGIGCLNNIGATMFTDGIGLIVVGLALPSLILTTITGRGLSRKR